MTIPISFQWIRQYLFSVDITISLFSAYDNISLFRIKLTYKRADTKKFSRQLFPWWTRTVWRRLCLWDTWCKKKSSAAKTPFLSLLSRFLNSVSLQVNQDKNINKDIDRNISFSLWCTYLEARVAESRMAAAAEEAVAGQSLTPTDWVLVHWTLDSDRALPA